MAKVRLLRISKTSKCCVSTSLQEIAHVLTSRPPCPRSLIGPTNTSKRFHCSDFGPYWDHLQTSISASCDGDTHSGEYSQYIILSVLTEKL